MNYRDIFHDDKVSFGEMQVYPLVLDYMSNPERLENIWVYDDRIVKGMVHIEGGELAELYVDSFFFSRRRHRGALVGICGPHVWGSEPVCIGKKCPCDPLLSASWLFVNT